MGDMADATESSSPASWWTAGRTAAVIVIAGLLVAGGLALISQLMEQRESDRRSDVYYCTLSGIGVLDRGPKTGELCGDLLYDD